MSREPRHKANLHLRDGHRQIYTARRSHRLLAAVLIRLGQIGFLLAVVGTFMTLMVMLVLPFVSLSS